jgi:hypothetical protein
MRDTEAIIVGEFAKAFFTGEDPPKELELLFPLQEREDFQHSQKRWNSFFGKPGKTLLPLLTVNCDNHWTQEVSRDDLRQI